MLISDGFKPSARQPLLSEPQDSKPNKKFISFEALELLSDIESDNFKHKERKDNLLGMIFLVAFFPKYVLLILEGIDEEIKSLAKICTSAKKFLKKHPHLPKEEKAMIHKAIKERIAATKKLIKLLIIALKKLFKANPKIIRKNPLLLSVYSKLLVLDAQLKPIKSLADVKTDESSYQYG